MQKRGLCLHSRQSFLPSPSSSAALEPTPVQRHKKKPTGPSHPLHRWGDGWGREHWSRTTQKVYGSPYNLGRGWFCLAEGSLEPQTLKVAEGTHFIQVRASRRLQMRTRDPERCDSPGITLRPQFRFFDTTLMLWMV